MVARFGADILVVVHLAFVLFVVGGGLLVAWKPWIAWLHVPAVTWGVVMEAAGWVCPLTPWEQRLRAAAGVGGYAGGFLDHHVLPLLYPEGLSRDMQWGLAACLLALNLWIYARLWRRFRA